MKHKDKIAFLRALQKLDKTLNIKEEILPKLKEELNNKAINEKEEIVLDLVEGINGNNEFLRDILEGIETHEIIEKVNERISTNNPDEIRKIEKRHVLFIKILVENNLLEIDMSKVYVANVLNILVSLNDTQQIYNYFYNPTPPDFQNTIQKIIFTEEYINDLLFLHVLNLYLHDKLNEFLNQNDKQNQMKTLIASYTKVSSRIPKTQKLLVPLSIIMIFTNIYNQPIDKNNFGRVNTNEIFQIINQNSNLENSFTEYLDILRGLNLLYDFLKEIENSLNQINENYIKKILKILLGNSLYSEELLIDFCILFSNKVPEEYKEIIRQKTEENNYWYKDFVIENLEREEEILHNEALEFLKFVENWYENKELKKKVKQFIRNHIDHLLKKDNIFNIYKILIENGEKFELNYTTKDFGKTLIHAFWELDKENEKLIYTFENVDKLFKKQDLNIFKSKLFGEIINNLEKYNKYQYKTLEKSKLLLKIDKNQIEELFRKLIDIRDNKNPFLLFKLVVENNKRKLNKDLKKNFKEKLEDIKENVENEDIGETIDEILEIL